MDKTAFVEIAGYYRKNIYPKISSLRGATRLKAFLERIALKSLGVERREEGCVYPINDSEVRMKDFDDFMPLFDEPQFSESFIQEMSKDSSVADLGARHGFYTALAAALTDNRVYSFEMDPDNVVELRKNIDLDEKDVEIIQRGVYDTETTITAKLGEGGASTIGGEGEEIETVSLDSYFNDKQTPSLLKIDVEGSEYKALKGAETVLEEKPVIFLELHKGQRLKGFEHEAEDVLNYLQSKGYSINKVNTRNESEMIICE